MILQSSGFHHYDSVLPREGYLCNDGPWCIQQMDIQIGYLYPHIHMVLQSSVWQNMCSSKHSFLVYSLRKNSVLKGGFNNTVMRWTFKFVNKEETLLSLKLIICPDTVVGMILLPIQLLSESSPLTHADLMTFNYYIQKSKDTSAPKLELVNDDEPIFVTLPLLVSELLKPIIGGYHLFNENRYHVFTYVQVFQRDVLQMNEETLDDFIRTCKNQTSDYQPAENDRKETIIQLFKNIYFGSSVEGSAMMMLSKGTSFEIEIILNMYAFLCPRDGRINPLPCGLRGILCYISGNININLIPFTALCLMAGHGIAIDTP